MASLVVENVRAKGAQEFGLVESTEKERLVDTGCPSHAACESPVRVPVPNARSPAPCGLAGDHAGTGLIRCSAARKFLNGPPPSGVPADLLLDWLNASSPAV